MTRRALPLALSLPLLAAAAAAQVVYLGGELPLNATTAGAQLAPALAGTADGGFLAAWHSFGQDGSGAGVYGRRFSAEGAALAGEFPLATTTAGDQVTPALAARGGVRIAVWAAQGKDGDGFAVVARRFDAAAAPLGGEILVNQTTAGSQSAPRVAASDAGFVVVWTGPNPASPAQSEVWFRRFGLDGVAAGGEVRANGATTGNQLQPAVAMAADGSFLIAWASDDGDGSGYGVFARRFDAAGAATTGDLPVPTQTLFDQSAPVAAALAGGGFAVAWQSALQAETQELGPQPVILVQRFDAAGAKAGPAIAATEQSVDAQELPALAAAADGGFVVAWQVRLLASGDRQTRGRRYDAAGGAQSGEFPLNTTAAGDQIAPALAGLGAGRFVAAWASFGQDGASWGLFAQRFGAPLEPCAPDATTLCLNDERFEITVSWSTALGTSGVGQAVPLTADTGYFWFFAPENVEIVIKALDACSPFGNFWIFAGGLTNVQTTIVVTDTATGESQVYSNPLGTMFQPIQDSGHFFVCAAATPAPRPEPLPAATAAPVPAAAAAAACAPGATTLCLNGGRFEVTVDWETWQGATGLGQAVPLTGDTGYFWFFGAANVEMVIKVLDGCGVNGSYWVFAGGLTDVFTHVRVRDTATGAVWERTNPQQTPFQPIQDVNAFPGCP